MADKKFKNATSAMISMIQLPEINLTTNDRVQGYFYLLIFHIQCIIYKNEHVFWLIWAREIMVYARVRVCVCIMNVWCQISDSWSWTVGYTYAQLTKNWKKYRISCSGSFSSSAAFNTRSTCSTQFRRIFVCLCVCAYVCECLCVCVCVCECECECV